MSASSRQVDRVRRFLISLAGLAMTAGCADRVNACFAPETVVPTRESITQDRALGQSARDLALALLEDDLTQAKALLERDPALARMAVGRDYDMLVVALATCRRTAVDLLISKGAPVSGVRSGVPLIIALRMNEPWFAERLLEAGAAATPGGGDPLGPMRTAIGLASQGGVRMLLDHGADVNARDRLGGAALHTALNMEQFGIAELLLDRGANPWAITAGGGNLASAASEPMLTASDAEAAAQRRLAERVRRMNWPEPIPTTRQVRALALAGEWPPAVAKNAPPVPDDVIAIIKANTVTH